MKHNRKGNCWAIPKDRNNDVVDVCKKHDEVRGDCSVCPRCEVCDAETPPVYDKCCPIGERMPNAIAWKCTTCGASGPVRNGAAARRIWP